MVTEPAELLERARLTFADPLRLVTDESWERPSGCGVWSVGALVTHVVGATSMYAVVLRGGSGDEGLSTWLETTTSAGEASGAFERIAREVELLLLDPEAPRQEIHHPAGDVSAEQMITYALVEWTLHGRDLAQALGTFTSIEPVLAEEIYRAIEPFLDRFRAFGVFEPALEVPSTASPSDRLLALVGRAP
jgi:uncharacterized protein (TIGR03086 family)